VNRTSGPGLIAAGKSLRWGVVGLLAVVAVASCTSDEVEDEGAAEGIDLGSLTASSDRPASSGHLADAELFRVVSVADGDTLRVTGSGGEQKVRILGINTPESGECFSEEATVALEGLVDGTDLVLVSDVTDRDRFDRLLRYVETADGVDVGAELVAGGYAIARRFEPDVARADRYAELQEQARRDEIGLWADNACGARAVEGDVIEIFVNANAPGDDEQNLNGEWVEIANIADETIDLGGWEIGDESSSHRYTFGQFTLPAGQSVTIYSGCGSDNSSELFWCDGLGPVWSNAGDTVFIRDPNGNLIALHPYGDSA